MSVFGGTPEYWAGFCSDTTPAGVPFSPPRPKWSALASPHYDGGSRYPDYRNVSKNLAVLQTLQFLLSVTTNLVGKIDDAQKQVTQVNLNLADVNQDLAGSIAPQSTGHCICANKSECDPTKILDTVDKTIATLVDQQHIDQVFSDYLTQQVQATLNDADGLAKYLAALSAPGGAIDTQVRLTLELTTKQQIAAAATKMKPGAAAACDPKNIPTYGADVATAVEAADKALRDQIDADAKLLNASLTAAATLPESTLKQIRQDVETLRTLFADVHSAKDLTRIDWAATKAKLQTMVDFYQKVVTEVGDKAKALSAIWNDLNQYPTLAARVTTAIHDQLQKSKTKAAACVAALDDPASYQGQSKPADFTAGFNQAVKTLVQAQWLDAKSHVDSTLQSINDRLAGAGAGTTAVAVFDKRLSDAAAAISKPVTNCYGRDTRPACFTLCKTEDPGEFLWLPVDFLQDPKKAAGGVASASLFALEQAGWLDQVSAWVQSQSGLQKDLGARLGAAKMALSGIAKYLAELQKSLGSGLGYVDRFTEGYHLGAYGRLRVDLHQCVPYAGHGVYAQLGGLGSDNFSLGARYTVHNLSAENRLQFRSGGFAVSAFGHDLSLAPTVEIATQIDGFRLWDQRRPLGIPIGDGLKLKVADVKKLDVFNVVPLDKYPFGFSESVPLGATIVRDLMPSRRTTQSAPDWPRPGVDAPWEGQSTAGVSLGLNLGFDLGPERYDLAEIDVIPRILVAIPWFQISAGVKWTQQTNLFRDRIQEMVNVNLPASVRLADKDFQRDSEAFQAPDLTDDDRTAAYVEPTLGVDAFLGFRLWRINIGAGAGIGLAANLRPGGQGGVLDLSTPLADAVLVSNPPADAECKPVWAFEPKTACSNKAFPESKATYTCEAREGKKSCCIQAVWSGGRESFCVDDWTGLTEADCKKLNFQDVTVPKIEAAVPNWKLLAGLKSQMTSLFDRVKAAIAISSTWNASTCAASKCAARPLFTTAGLDVYGVSQCETFGRCSYPDGTVRQDTTLVECEKGEQRFTQVSVGKGYGCALRGDGSLVCWGASSTRADRPPAGHYLSVSAGDNHACAVREDGTLACWGDNSSGQAMPPAGKFASVTAGNWHSCGLRTDSVVVCWGRDPLSVPGSFRQVDAGSGAACGIRADGTVECFKGWSGPAKPLSGSYQLVRTGASNNTLCALRSDGQVVCYRAPQGSSQCNEAGMAALLKTPSGTFKDIVHGLACTACGLRVDGGVSCWGGLLATVPEADVRLTSFAGTDQGNELCGLQADGTIRCWNLSARLPAAATNGTFSPYSCRSVTEATVKAWQGNGCHPLQQGFPSACACDTDAQCIGNERCDTAKRTCMGAGGAAISCLAGNQGGCPSGRVPVSGACARACQAKADCAGGLLCEQGRCVPASQVPFAEQIAWSAAHPQPPRHTIGTYALSDFKATLLLKADLYVEASFTLFRKPRVWRLYDYHDAWDLGSTWKGWYAPGLDARYQHECQNAQLDEPVTNRYPRSATASSFDAVFATAGIADPIRQCGAPQGGGVCRYPQSLPARRDRPELYSRGNAGDVASLLRWCAGDLPRHAEDPGPSENAQLGAGIADSVIWGRTVAVDVWGRNRVCVDGMLWDEWFDALDGKGAGGGALERAGCGYRDPRSGQSFTFPCKDTSESMLEIWGCTAADANGIAVDLVKQFPQLAVSGPVTGKRVIDVGAVFGPGSPLTLENMAPAIRFASSSPGTPFAPRLGERWLEAADLCFGSRFEDPAENVCACRADADCNRAAGERCAKGHCEQPRTVDAAGTCLRADCSPIYQARQCPVVFLDATVAPCCGDGRVERSARYSEECDNGPAGSTSCTPQCTARAGVTGACCTSAGHCTDGVPQADCSWQWHAGRSCREVSSCEAGAPGGGGAPRCVPAPAGLALWLPLDEGPDLSAFGERGVVLTAATAATGPLALNVAGRSSTGRFGAHAGRPTPLLTGKVGGALCFDGQDDRVDVPVYADISFGGGDFSLAAWVLRRPGRSGTDVLVDRRADVAGGVRGYSLFLYDGQLGLQLADGAYDNYLSRARVPDDGLWHHVAATVIRGSRTGGRFYLDGLPADPVFDPTRRSGTLNTSAPFRVGARSSLAASGEFSAVLRGCLDEVEAYRRALAADEVLAIYRAGAQGKCKQRCEARSAAFCGDQTAAAYNEVCNYSSFAQSFEYSFQGLPAQTGCAVPGPMSFAPSSGTLTVPAGTCTAVTPRVGRPPALPAAIGTGVSGCYQMLLRAPTTEETFSCVGHAVSDCVGI